MNFYVLVCQRLCQSVFNQIKTFRRDALVIVFEIHSRFFSDFFYFKCVLNLSVVLILLQASLVYEISPATQLQFHDVSSDYQYRPGLEPRPLLPGSTETSSLTTRPLYLLLSAGILFHKLLILLQASPVYLDSPRWKSCKGKSSS